MENIRVILAAASLAIGVLLLIIAFFRTSARRSTTAANWIFGGLFFVAAALLWVRGSETKELTHTPVVKAAPGSPSKDSKNLGDQTALLKSESSITQADTIPSASNSRQDQLAEGGDEKGIDNSLVSSAPSQPKESTRRVMPSLARVGGPLPGRTPAQNWDDQLYAAVDASFDWIEKFFEKYATPTIVVSRKAKGSGIADHYPTITFPAIRFNEGTAELTSESQIDLKILATRLTSEYPKNILEIQAYVDSVGPEAFNFVLTQARAEAVRDLLIAEGIDEFRLIARGYGTGDNPDLTDARIEFIVRR